MFFSPFEAQCPITFSRSSLYIYTINTYWFSRPSEVRSNLVSAAVGCLWLQLTEQLPTLLKRLDTAVVALTVLLGSAASDTLRWLPEYEGAIARVVDKAFGPTGR